MADEAADRGDVDTADELTQRARRIERDFVEANTGLIDPILRKFRIDKAHQNMQVYVQEGRLAILEAFRKWDPDHEAVNQSTGQTTNVTFGTFSRLHIKGRIHRSVHEHEGNGGTFHDFSDTPKIKQIIDEFAEMGILRPSNEEVAELAEQRFGKRVTVGQVERIRRPKDTSLNRRVGENGDTELGELIAGSLESDDDADGDELSDSPVLELLARVEAKALLTRMEELEIPADEVLAMSPEELRELLVEVDSRAMSEILRRRSAPSQETLEHMSERLTPRGLFVVMRRDGLDGAERQTSAQLSQMTGLGREALRRQYLAALSSLLDEPSTEDDEPQAEQVDEAPSLTGRLIQPRLLDV